MLLETENAPGWVTWPCLVWLCVVPQAGPCSEAAAVSNCRVQLYSFAEHTFCIFMAKSEIISTSDQCCTCFMKVINQRLVELGSPVCSRAKGSGALGCRHLHRSQWPVSEEE